MKNIMFPSLLVEQGLLKKFVKVLPGDCFKVLILAFPSLSSEKKIKVNMFDDPQIQQLIKDDHFIGTMSELQKNVSLSFKDIVKIFLGNT